ncbi:MAG: cytochrome c-type biogenesis protein [Actinomycetota bacterium]
MTRRWLPWVALLAVVAVALVVLVARSQPSDSIEARARRLERELACPVCVGESLAESNAPEARAMRADIRDRMRAGQSDAEIIDAYVSVYGPDIKLKPDDDGIALVAWGLPVVAVVIGAAGIGAALRRWSREPRLAATADDEVLVARERREAQ